MVALGFDRDKLNTISPFKRTGVRIVFRPCPVGSFDRDVKFTLRSSRAGGETEQIAPLISPSFFFFFFWGGGGGGGGECEKR